MNQAFLHNSEAQSLLNFNIYKLGTIKEEMLSLTTHLVRAAWVTCIFNLKVGNILLLLTSFLQNAWILTPLFVSRKEVELRVLPVLHNFIHFIPDEDKIYRKTEVRKAGPWKDKETYKNLTNLFDKNNWATFSQSKNFTVEIYFFLIHVCIITVVN